MFVSIARIQRQTEAEALVTNTFLKKKALLIFNKVYNAEEWLICCPT